MKKVTPAKVEELLDSDDEFPMDYYEEPTLPAYQNDHRFDMIHFKWIGNLSLKDSAKPPSPDQLQTNSFNEPEIKKHIYIDKPIVTRGVLKKEDLFCLKSVESYGDSTLIWFFNFLILKDLQSNYVFLRSCLVNNYLFGSNLYIKNKVCKQETENFYTLNIMP